MRYAIFSDVHANYEAFRAVLDDVRQMQVGRYVFVGDIVGYGPDPEACIALLQDLIETEGCVCVAGNHDYATAGLSPYDQYNVYARESIDWTRQQLSDPELAFLAQLPLVNRVPYCEQVPPERPSAAMTRRFTVVHANLTAPQKWGYILDIDDALPNFNLAEEPLCFIGHSHKPVCFIKSRFLDWVIEDRIEIQEGVQYIVNVGSVGQPRDGDPRACYAVLDDGLNRIEMRRVAYDVPAVQEKIIRAGLPKILAERLSVGK